MAFKLALKAIQNGWIFIYLKNPALLAESLRMAKIIDGSGKGVLIFTEDIDQVTRSTDEGLRGAALQDIVNTLDGGDTKDMNVISLFTTNHIELIDPTFLRGKRIGTVISMGFLDAETALKFMTESFAVGGFSLGEDMTEVCKLIERSDIAPAFMAEIVEAVKARLVFDNRTSVTAFDVEYAVKSYLHQVELARKKPAAETPAQALANNLKSVLISDMADSILAQIKELKEKLDE